MNVVALRRLGPRRRHDHQLDQLPAHQALGARAVGARARPRGPRRPRRSTATSTPSGSASSVTDRCSDLNGPQTRMQRRAPTRSAGRSRRSRATSTRRATRRRAPASSASATRPAPSSRRRRTYLADAVDARRGADRALLRRARAGRGRPRGRAWRRVYADPETGRSARVTVRAPRVVVACGALESPGAAAAQRHRRRRRSASTCACTRAPRDRRPVRAEDRAPGGARRRPALVDEFAERRATATAS